jgi:hypothetical protein
LLKVRDLADAVAEMTTLPTPVVVKLTSVTDVGRPVGVQFVVVFHAVVAPFHID